MLIRLMEEKDLPQMINIRMDYYNNTDETNWTKETSEISLRQTTDRKSAYCLVLEDDNKAIIGFVNGFFEQFHDIVGYALVEILISKENQSKGYGTILMEEIEKQVKEKGASIIQMQAVNDDFHHHFYGKLGYNNSSTYVNKVKWIGEE